MGEIGTAISDKNFIGSVNPAAWNSLNLTRLEVGLRYRGINAKNSESNDFTSNTYFSGFMFGFPIDNSYGISFAMGLMPYSRVNYSLTNNTTYEGIGDVSSSYSGNGGISKAFFGLSYALPVDFILGATFEYYFGEIEYLSQADFTGINKYQDASFAKNFNYNGIGTTIGLLSNDVSKFLNMETITDLRFGAAVNLIGAINTDTSITSQSSIASKKYSSGVTKTKIPYKLSAGLSFRYEKKYLFLLDYVTQPWSEFKYNDITSNLFQDLQRVSLGMEYSRSGGEFSSFWEQIQIRGGLSYEKSQYRIGGKNINQYSVHAGLTLPVGISNSLDMAFQYGVRGTEESNLIREDIFKFIVTLSLGQLWFVREER